MSDLGDLPGPPDGYDPIAESDPANLERRRRLQDALDLHHEERAQWRAAMTERSQIRTAAHTRVLLLSDVLRRARQGKLAPTWRDNLLPEAVPHPPSARQAVTATVQALQASPRALWEPWASQGDWRRALESWYAASLAIHDEDDLHHARWRATEPDLPGTPPTGDPAITIETNAAEAQHELMRAANQRRHRDTTTAWYLAGLAAGGDIIDWQRWYLARSGRTAEAPGWTANYPDWLQQLPIYWTEHQ